MSKSLLLEQTSSEDLLSRIGVIIEEKINNYFPKSLKNSEEKEEVLTIDQTAELLEVSRPSIYNYIKLGLLKPKKIGRSTRFLKSEVLDYLKNQK